ncbi:MAG: CARDB domain-containing protein [Candidatus Woesearchaeota archaeon]
MDYENNALECGVYGRKKDMNRTNCMNRTNGMDNISRNTFYAMLIFTFLIFGILNVQNVSSLENVSIIVIGNSFFNNQSFNSSFNSSFNQSINQSITQSSNFNIILSLSDTSILGKDFSSEMFLEIDYQSIDGTSRKYRNYDELIFPKVFLAKYDGEYTFSLIKISDLSTISKYSVTLTNISENSSNGNSNSLSGYVIGADLINENSENDEIDFVTESAKMYGCEIYELQIPKQTYVMGETIDLGIFDDSMQVYVFTSSGVFRFLPDDYGIASFIPPRPENYRLQLKCGQEIILEKTFSVVNNVIQQEIENSENINISNFYNINLSETNISDISNSDSDFAQNVMNERSITRNAKIRDSFGKSKEWRMTLRNHTGQVGRKDAEIILNDLEGFENSRMKLNNFEEKNETLLKIERVETQKISLNKKIMRAYAIDLSSVNFETGTFTRIASGKELWKCRDWIFDTQTCAGQWEKIMDLNPGQEYSIEIYPNDPGYAETGLATINTDKSIYVPGESVEITAVVLDNKGYLVRNAHVSIKIITPLGQEYFYSTDSNIGDEEIGTILEIDKGIYQSTFSDTSIEGVYNMEVNSYSRSGNNTMTSSFKVSYSHEFDIVRYLPATTDPFKGPFSARIQIIPRINVDYYNFTEVLPTNLLVLSAPDAVISYNNVTNRQELTWSGLTGDVEVSYVAQPELKSPDLLIIGKSFISYIFFGIQYIFEEFREWFLAIDPDVPTDDGLMVYVDRDPDGQIKYRNYTSSTLYPEVDTTRNLGNRGSWTKIKCLEESTQCIMGFVDNGDDLSVMTFYTNNWSFSALTLLTANTDNNGMPFDIECEDTSGRCLIAYEPNQASADAVFNYTIWNGTTLSARTAITVPSGENFDFRWIKLYPKKNSNMMGIALQNDAGGDGGTPAIYAGIWNGTGFGNWQTLTTNSPTNGNGYTQHKHFDCAWDGLGRLTCAFGNESYGGLLAYRFDGTTWSSLGNIYSGMGGEVWEVSLCGQDTSSTFNHTSIGVLACSYNATAPNNKIDGGVWNGTGFSKSNPMTSQPYRNNAAECGTNKGNAAYTGQNFVCKWEKSGDQALFLWTNNGDNFLRYAYYNPTTKTFSTTNWSLGNQIVVNGPNDIRTADLVSNPLNDGIFLIYTDSNRVAGCSVWTGSSWDGSGCNNSAVFETDGARPATSWISFDYFRYVLEPYITIYRPENTYTLKDYYGITNPSATAAAYNGTSATLPPNAANSPAIGTEFSSACYFATTSADDNICNVSSTAINVYAYQSYKFYISDSPLNIDSYTLYHEGRATRLTTGAATDFNVYVYNWTSDSYIFLRTIFGGGGVESYTETDFDASDDLIFNNTVYILLETATNSGAAANRRIELITDYISLEVSSVPAWSGNQLINSSATDRNNVSQCVWAFYNTTSRVNNLTVMSNIADFYYNVTDTSLVPDNLYSVTVSCNDSLNNRRNASSSVRIDNTLPSIRLINPIDYYNTTASSIIFSWNATDIPREILLCDLIIDEVAAASSVVSLHSSVVSRNITSIADGTHTWYVTCTDDAGNENSSETRTFDKDTVGPTVALSHPPHGSFLNYLPLDLNFTPTDSHNITNCSVYVDGLINGTIYNPLNGILTNFTVQNFTEGLHRWNVSCYDTFNFRGNSQTRNFTIDLTKPTIFLNTTNDILFNNTPVQLNYTVIDNIDRNLTCNITVNEEVVEINIPSMNNTLISKSPDLSDGYKTWYVTCLDDAGNVNVSDSRIFRVIGGPYIVLLSPPNNAINNGSNMSFKYYVQDLDGVSSCSMYLDDVLNQTNSTINNLANNTFFIPDLLEGYHYWNVTCNDLNNMTGRSTLFNFTSDRSPPTISLQAPISGQILTSTPARLNFTVTDAYSLNFTCNITLDGNVSLTNRNFVAYNNIMLSKTESPINGLHFWNVTCYDQGRNLNVSETWNFTVNVTFPLAVTVVADKINYHEREIAIINVTVRNESNHQVSANTTLDYIYTNRTFTDVPWWNTSFPNRRPVYINETQNWARTDKPILINFTFPLGTLTNCNQIRIINDVDLNQVAYNVISGDGVTFCNIAFNASVSANAVNEQNYHLYYGNTTVSAPSYPNLFGVYTLLFDAFNSLTSTWTAGTGWDIDTNNPITGTHLHIDGNPVVSDSIIRLTNSLSLKNYDNVNVSFAWDVNNNYDAAPKDYIIVEFSNNSGSTWTYIDELNSTFEAAGTTTLRFNLNSSNKVDGFNIRFRATINADNEETGVDSFNVSYWNVLQSNVSTSLGAEHTFIERILNSTTGNMTYYYNTENITYGNYSAVVYATTNNPRNRPGSGYDWFNVLQDIFGPVISLIYPSNGLTAHTGDITFTYNASDIGTTVANCSLYINGILNQTNLTINESSANSFIVPGMIEGRYNWSVRCYDNIDNNATSSTNTFYLDDTPPVVVAISPNASTVASGTVFFTFNATDNLDTLIFCNVSIDNGNSSRTLNANSGANTLTSVSNISAGFHTWFVQCYDNINNTANSSTLNFTAADIPIVALGSPFDGSGQNSTNMTFYYNLSSGNINNCSLILNGGINTTHNSSQIPYQSNENYNIFYLENMSYGIYTWNILCFDNNGFNGTGTTRTFHLDNALPSIALVYPANNQTLFTRNVNFMFNVTDIDNVLVCNLTIDGVLNRSNINANSGANTAVLVNSMPLTNHSWGVSCIDNTGFIGYSEIWNFTIESRVSVILNSPGNNTYDNDGNINFTHTPQSAATFTTGFCDLYVDGSFNQRDTTITDSSQNIFPVLNLAEGNHSWYVNCTDNVGTSGVSGLFYILVDKNVPGVVSYYPDGETLSSSIITFNWTATDNYDSSMICTVRVNGTAKTPTMTSPNGAVTNATYSGFTDGTLYWNVTCVDDALNSGVSTLKSFIVQEPPRIVLGNPPNGTRTRNQNQTLFFTATDNSGNISSCELIFDDQLNDTRSGVFSGVQSNFSIVGVPNGIHTWTANCTDPSGNEGTNSTPKYLIIDLDGPSINLLNPVNGQFMNGNNITFNWTATDYPGTNINCSLYIDNLYNRSVTQTSGATFTTLVPNMGDGTHDWFLNCSDNLNNTNVSETWSFTINQPDVYIDDIRISFNNTNPDENQTITIRANITNLGGVPVNNLLVEFWDGAPGVGLLIGNATGNIGFNSSTIFSTLWNITPGYHTIHVVSDPYNLIEELNESNNNATKNISLLISRIHSPFNMSGFVNPNISVNFSLTDFTTGYGSGLINYSVYVDNVFNGQTGQVLDGEYNLINVTVAQGTHGIKIEGLDYLGRRKNSTAVFVVVDFTAPLPVINTLNNSWFNYSNPIINISATDNRVVNISYLLYVNNTIDLSGNITNSTSLLVNLSSLIDGQYILIMEAWDDFNNYRNSTPKTIYVDTTPPNITLNSPDDGEIFTQRNVILNYTITDNLAQTLNCSVVLDGINVANHSNSNGISRTYNANNLIEGTHYWNVTCYDQARNIDVSETRSFDIFIAPSIVLVSPPNNFWSNSADNTFYFNVSDESGLENCSILFNGNIISTKTNTQITNNATNNFTVTSMNSGNYSWQIECYDNTTYHTYNITSNRTLYVDTIFPVPIILTQNDSWYRVSNPSISVNITDNMDLVLNYTIYVNGSHNVNGTANNASAFSRNLVGLVNGTYEIIVEAVDEAGNRMNSTPIIIHVDSIVPSIQLIYPQNATNLTSEFTDLNFTVTDNMAYNLMCNLTLDNVVNTSNINVSNGGSVNISVSGLNGGWHYWNVSCYDDAGNRNTSQTWSFFVVIPDIMVSSSNIYFSNNNPVENETIEVIAEIFNIGDNDAENFNTQIRLNGIAGLLLGNFTLTIPVGESMNISINYTLDLGSTTFYVIADTPISSNGTIQEKNESNNVAFRTVSVSSWHFVLGEEDGDLRMINPDLNTLYSWSLENTTGGKIYAADVDSNINWLNMTAISRRTNGVYVVADFNDIDVAFNIENNSDSVNRTYTLNNNPKILRNITVFNRGINNVPMFNSTNNSNFMTGILWDSGDGGIEFNRSQDLIFVSEINMNALGYNDTYDFEMRLPAKLRVYKTGVDAVALYAEIK